MTNNKIKISKNKKQNSSLTLKEQELIHQKRMAIEYIASQTNGSFANMQSCFNDLRKEVIKSLFSRRS